nr:MAG TPA: hypothetical protein [Caudoviricetes sp.]
MFYRKIYRSNFRKSLTIGKIYGIICDVGRTHSDFFVLFADVK